MINMPRDLRYSTVDGDKYRKLREDELSPFKGATYAEIFTYAAAYGYRNGIAPIELDRPQPNIPISAFGEENLWLLLSIAIASAGSLSVLGEERLFKISEEYANAAIGVIYRSAFGGEPGDPYIRLAREVYDDWERTPHQCE